MRNWIVELVALFTKSGHPHLALVALAIVMATPIATTAVLRLL